MDDEPKKSRSLEFTLGLIILISLIAFVFIRIDIRAKRAHQERAFGNVRLIGYALIVFDSDFGTFPSETTIEDVNSVFPDNLSYDFSGKSSNAIFRQLLAAGIVGNEELFYAKIKNTVDPDGYITPGEGIKKGECGFAYIAGLSSKDNPSTPLVLTPLIPGTTKFDPKPFSGNAIINHIDNSVSYEPIDDDGSVYIKGIDILSPTNPIWKGKAPDIRYPE
ncbi:MAG: hypothetical protein ACK49X_07115 [Akkermansiaceae bacterium]|jgi:hypothetical protein